MAIGSDDDDDLVDYIFPSQNSLAREKNKWKNTNSSKNDATRE